MNRRSFLLFITIVIVVGGYLLINKIANPVRIYQAQAVLTANTIDVKSFAIGQIEEIFVKDGDYIEEGQKLLTINTILGRVGDNTSDGTINDGSSSSTVYAPSKGLVTNLLVTRGDSIELYSQLLNIIDTNSYALEVKIRKEWIEPSKTVKVGDEIVWINPNNNNSNIAKISYIYPYLDEDELKFKASLNELQDNLFINQKLKVEFE